MGSGKNVLYEQTQGDMQDMVGRLSRILILDATRATFVSCYPPL
jgi:hypothetical protein